MIKSTDTKLIEKLLSFNKSYFTVSDLEKVLEVKNKNSLNVVLNRMGKRGIVEKLMRGIYVPGFQKINLSKIANELYYPSYISFESALQYRGISDQIPQVITFATKKRTKTIFLDEQKIIFRQISDSLFWGFDLADGLYMAEPEKAILDQIYMVVSGKSFEDCSEWNLERINKSKLLKYARKYPKNDATK